MEICICIPNLIKVGYFTAVIWRKHTIFKIAAVRHLEFSKIAVLSRELYRNMIFSYPIQISHY